TAPPARRSGRARRAGRSLHPLHEHVDLAAAREADLPRLLVGDPVAEQLRLARLHHLAGVLVDVRLDAAARHRAAHLPGLGDGEARPHGPGRRPPRGDHRRDDHLLALLTPPLDLVQYLFHAACLLSIPARTPARSSRLARLCPGRKRSTYGSAARIPPASGS